MVRSVEIKIAGPGDNAGILGAAKLALDSREGGGR